MAYTFDAKTSASATSTGLTVSHTCGAGADLLDVSIAIRGLQTISSLTYAGQALTLAKDQNNSSNDEHVVIYYKVAPAAGANNVIVGLSGSVEHYVSVVSFFADDTPALDVTGGASGAGGGSTISGSVSGATGTLAVDAVVTENNANPPFTSAGGDQTVIHNFSSASFGIATSYELSPAAAEQFDWTHSGAGSDWGMALAVFDEVPAGPPAHPYEDPTYGLFPKQKLRRSDD